VGWGEIARFIFTDAQDELELRLVKFISSLDLSLVLTYMKTAELSEKHQQKISHILVQYRIVESDMPFERVELDFASNWIGQQIVDASATKDWKKLISHYEEVRRAEWQGAYCGHLWEHLCHAIIPRGTKEGFQLESLSKTRIAEL
jgi:hypothetical protein